MDPKTHKIVILGAGTVGKSAITIRMVANEFKGKICIKYIYNIYIY